MLIQVRLVWLVCLPIWVGGMETSIASEQGEINRSEVFFTEVATTSQKALLAPFLASTGPIDTGISLSNVLAAPPGIVEEFEARFSNLEGTLEFYFWNSAGELVFYETGPESPGSGLSLDGTLAPGQTYTVLLSELLASAGYEETSFAGYAWVVANFDAVQGTANVTDFSSFTQSTVMQPDIGSSFFDYDANAGVPISPPD